MKRLPFSLSLLSIIFIFGCATHPPVKIRNPEITRLNLPDKGFIQGVVPIKHESKSNNIFFTSIETVCNFYGSPITKRAIILGSAAAVIESSAATVIVGNTMMGSTDYIQHILEAHGFKQHFFWYEDSLKFQQEIKFFLSQGYPIIFGSPTSQANIRYLVFVGYDDIKETFIACNPGIGEIVKWSYKEFNTFYQGAAWLIYPRELNYSYKGPDKLEDKGPPYKKQSHQLNKEISPQEINSPPEKADIPQQVQPPLAEKQQVPTPVTPPATGVYQTFKPQPPPISEPKQSTKQPMLVKECGTPIWNIGDSWKFGSGEIKLIRVEENLYIAENSSSSDLAAYDKNTLEKTFSIDDKGGRVKIKSSSPIYFDFPLYVGKKWKRHFSARPSFATRDYNYLMEYKVLRIEDITVSAGTFKAFKIEINHTNYEAKVSGKAHIWYSPKVKLFVKVALDGSSYWRGAQGFELMSFNLKDKEKSPKEIKLPLEKVDIPPQVQPTLVEKQKVAPPIAPSLSTHEQGVDIPSKSQLPVTEKKKVPAFAPPPQSTDFVVVTGTSANIRTGAGNEFPTVTTVNQGAKLTLLGEYGKWFNVRLENGQEGWINSRFVQE